MTKAVAIAFAILAFASRAMADDSLRLRPGASTTITLRENPSTGYSWRIDGEASRGLGSIVVIEDAGFERGASMPGAPGVHRWTLRGLQSGAARIVMTHERPWERKPVDSKAFTVEVEP